MEEPLVRGHLLARMAGFYRTTYDRTTSARVEGELSVELKAALETLDPADWYPRRFHVELLNAFAAVRGSGPTTYNDFLSCGAELATPDHELSHLLLKLLTPELFLKKLPRFWSRDHRGSGTFEIEPAGGDASSRRVTLRGIERYEHGAIVWLGFMRGMLSRVSSTTPQIEQVGWSWSSPAPQQVVYEVRWR